MGQTSVLMQDVEKGVSCDAETAATESERAQESRVSQEIACGGAFAFSEIALHLPAEHSSGGGAKRQGVSCMKHVRRRSLIF